jgi:hypothetical protein
MLHNKSMTQKFGIMNLGKEGTVVSTSVYGRLSISIVGKSLPGSQPGVRNLIVVFPHRTVVTLYNAGLYGS